MNMLIICSKKSQRNICVLFFVEFGFIWKNKKLATDINNIYDMKSLLQCKIKFKQVYARLIVPQCSKC